MSTPRDAPRERAVKRAFWLLGLLAVVEVLVKVILEEIRRRQHAEQDAKESLEREEEESSQRERGQVATAESYRDLLDAVDPP